MDHQIAEPQQAAERDPETVEVAALSEASDDLLGDEPDSVDTNASGAVGIDVPAVLLRINRRWKPGMDEDALYDAVYGWWKIGPKREQADYAIAVAQGQVRGVFRILGWRAPSKGDRGWEEDEPDSPKWGFDGEPAPELTHLVGRDVSGLFPRGAANPVRYLNLGAPAPARVARISSQPASTTVPLGELERICDRLCANPVLHLSLHSKELFHSNTIGWLIEAHPDLGIRALEPWLVRDDDQREFDVLREHHSLDLVVKLPGYRPLVIENKTFSLPDMQQLQRYDGRNIRSAGLGGAIRLLLSLPDPGWAEWKGWRWVSYADLADRLAPLVQPLRERDDFAGQLLERYVEMVRDLLLIMELTQVQDDGEPVQLDGDRLATLKRIRLHDVVQKLRARQLAHRVTELLAADGITSAVTASDLTNGAVLVEASVPWCGDDTVGWQLQGGQWRRFLRLRRLSGRGDEAKDRRAQLARTDCAEWFDFSLEGELGAFQEGPAEGFNHYDPDFVYRYVKLPGLTVGELLHLARTVTAQAVEWAQRQAEREQPGEPQPAS